jgi:hypothetical protein
MRGIPWIFPSFVASLSGCRSKLKARAADLHIDNAKSQPFSPELAPSDFFLLGYFKSKLEGKTFFDEDDVKEEVRRILMEIPGT